MNTAKPIAVLGLLAMTGALIYGFAAGDFASDGAELLKNPWGVVSIIDLYTGFLLFSMWIIYRKKSLLHSVVWVIMMMVLGFFTGALYTLYALYTSNGDWKVFWMGRRVSS